MSLNSHQLRKTHPRLAKKIGHQTKKQEIVLVLDNVLDNPEEYQVKECESILIEGNFKNI